VSSLRNARLVPSPSLMAEERPRCGETRIPSRIPAARCRLAERSRMQTRFSKQNRIKTAIGYFLPPTVRILRFHSSSSSESLIIVLSRSIMCSRKYGGMEWISTGGIHQIRPYFRRKISFSPCVLHLPHVAEDFLIRSSPDESQFPRCIQMQRAALHVSLRRRSRKISNELKTRSRAARETCRRNVDDDDTLFCQEEKEIPASESRRCPAQSRTSDRPTYGLKRDSLPAVSSRPRGSSAKRNRAAVR